MTHNEEAPARGRARGLNGSGLGDQPTNLFSSVPQELQSYPQFVCWRYEAVSGGKPKKPPYDPKTGRLASVNYPATWDTFDNAISAFNAGGYDGIGFVLTENDPFAFIDLDETHGDADALDRQRQIFAEFDSYSERSPSGDGLHIIVKGSVPSGRRRGSVEVYSSARYMTLTGDAYRDVPIRDRRSQTTKLWETLGEPGAKPKGNGHDPANGQTVLTDEEIRARSLATDLGAKLLGGDWSSHKSNPSEATFALIGHLLPLAAFDQEAVFRIVMASPLGSRPGKYQDRPELLRDEIATNAFRSSVSRMRSEARSPPSRTSTQALPSGGRAARNATCIKVRCSEYGGLGARQIRPTTPH